MESASRGDCCELAPQGQQCPALSAETGHDCARCGAGLKGVTAAHVKRHVRRPIAFTIEGRYEFCPAESCPVVFIASDGATFLHGALRHPPAYKSGNLADLLCFCFDFRGTDFHGDTADEAVAFIRERISAGECACDILNPSAGCCLGSIAKFRASLRASG